MPRGPKGQYRPNDPVAAAAAVVRDGDPELIWADSMKRNDVRRAMRIVTEHQMLFLERWTKIHG